jgi:hypothetical protein
MEERVNLELRMYLITTTEGYYLLDPNDKVGVMNAFEKGLKVVPLFSIATPKQVYTH